MTLFEDSHFKWRETYFVAFDQRRRPTVEQMRCALEAVDEHFLIDHVHGDADGRFESLTCRSPSDHAALDISYEDDSDIREQNAQIAIEIGSTISTTEDRKKIDLLGKLDARFDVLHFEEIEVESDEEESTDEILDPTALIAVLEQLVKLTGGIGVDPQSGTIV